MAESNGCEKALRSVTRGGAVSTNSPGRVLSNMRDCVATMEVHCTRAGSGGKLKCEKKEGQPGMTVPEEFTVMRPGCSHGLSYFLAALVFVASTLAAAS